MGSAFRAVVIGVGHLGQHHARILSALDNVDLIGVVDVIRGELNVFLRNMERMLSRISVRCLTVWMGS